jgi:hypothetical protein
MPTGNIVVVPIRGGLHVPGMKLLRSMKDLEHERPGAVGGKISKP